MAGTSFSKWIKLLFQNGFRVDLKYLPKALVITLLSLILSPFILIEKILYEEKIQKVKLKKSPIFILGHWRSGTTHLHNILSRDDSFIVPTVIEVVFPSIFLILRKIVSILFHLFMPRKRPPDDVTLSQDEPQEHEYSLASLCLYSPYIGFFFPNNRQRYFRYFDFKEATDKELNLWKNRFIYFLKKIQFMAPDKQILLKNPFDTYRIKLILDLFPDARFIHIYRNPYHVFPSTRNMYIKNSTLFLLQNPKFDLDELIFDLHLQMYDNFYEDIQLIPKGNYVEISYEDLIKSPLKELQHIYTNLSIRNFNSVKQKFHAYLESVKKYIKGEYKLRKEDRDKISSRLRQIIERWGYEKPLLE